jgi:hypothetical protein
MLRLQYEKLIINISFYNRQLNNYNTQKIYINYIINFINIYEKYQ